MVGEACEVHLKFSEVQMKFSEVQLKFRKVQCRLSVGWLWVDCSPAELLALLSKCVHVIIHSVCLGVSRIFSPSGVGAGRSVVQIPGMPFGAWLAKFSEVQ